MTRSSRSTLTRLATQPDPCHLSPLLDRALDVHHGDLDHPHRRFMLHKLAGDILQLAERLVAVEQREMRVVRPVDRRWLAKRHLESLAEVQELDVGGNGLRDGLKKDVTGARRVERQLHHRLTRPLGERPRKLSHELLERSFVDAETGEQRDMRRKPR